jgi:lactoylglutathione lyase
MRFLHCMLRVRDIEETLAFYCGRLGLRLLRRKDHPQGQFTLLFLSASSDGDGPEIELTFNWDGRSYSGGDNFGHLAFAVEDIYGTCARLQADGVVILRPPRDGKMAFIKDPNGISIELLQAGAPLPPREPWATMPSRGTW